MSDFDFSANTEKFSADLLDELRLFSAFYDGSPIRVDFSDSVTLCASIVVGEFSKKFDSPLPCGDGLEVKRITKRFLKTALYDTLSEHYGVKLPWGSLTGVRPTKLAYDYLSRGGSPDGISSYMQSVFRVDGKHADIIEKIIDVQRPYIEDLSDKVNLYIHVPYCDGKCIYCSFPSADVNAKNSRLGEYLDALIKEISVVKEFIARNGKHILSVYIGGGTPSVLDANGISRLLRATDMHGAEFTFEAGRPDSITRDKLKAMRDGGVTRVCINPQTLNDRTLERIGRRHTTAQFFKAYETAAEYGFDINTDIIAGLGGENLDDFIRTVDGIFDLSPSNVTVHTLCRKRGSGLADSAIYSSEAERMTEYAANKLSGYVPYYLYRQKNMVGNLENIGYAVSGHECINNITVMEELAPVYACGAGSISKLLGGAIARHASPKDIGLYLSEFDERLKQKLNFFSCAETSHNFLP